MKPEALLSAQEAAAMLGVSRPFVTRHAVELGGIRVGRLLKFRQASLNRYLDQQAVTVPVAVQPAPTPIRKPALAGSRVMNPVTGRPFESMAR